MVEAAFWSMFLDVFLMDNQNRKGNLNVTNSFPTWSSGANPRTKFLVLHADGYLIDS